MNSAGFLGTAPPSAAAQQLFADDVDELGYVMNASRLWAHQPQLLDALFGLLRSITTAHWIDRRTRGVLVAACASAFGDSYCSLAWGSKLAAASDPATAAAVLRGTDTGLSGIEQALADWARKLVRGPNSTCPADVAALREAGLDDAHILAVTTFVALRIAFCTVNDALGVRPDAALRQTAPAAVLEAVTFGRPVEDVPENG